MRKLDPLPSEQVMRDAGFTDHRPTHWYYTKNFGGEITLNITIDKATGEYETVVLDEFICQPYMYGNYGLVATITAGIDRVLAELAGYGVHVTHNHEEYRSATNE